VISPASIEGASWSSSTRPIRSEEPPFSAFHLAKARRTCSTTSGWRARSGNDGGEDAPSIDAGEITDKGYINQRLALAHRAAAVERLFADEPDADVIVIDGG